MRRSSRRVPQASSSIARVFVGAWLVVESRFEVVSQRKSTGGRIFRFLSTILLSRKPKAIVGLFGKAMGEQGCDRISGTPASSESRYEDLDGVSAVKENDGLSDERFKLGEREAEALLWHGPTLGRYRKEGSGKEP
jgi:hypothetical protein